MKENRIKKPPKKVYGIIKTFDFEAYHNGNFKEKNHPDNIKHKHKFVAIIQCKSSKLNSENVVIDFRYIDKLVEEFSGKYLNELLKNKAVTCEFLANYILEYIPNCFLCELVELNVEGETEGIIPGKQVNKAWASKELEDY